jgi:hypothetical protein
MNDATTATLIVAAVTGGLVLATFFQVFQNRKALNQSIRPLLADPTRNHDDGDSERILFGAPGRDSPHVPRGRLYLHRTSGMLQLSIPFENVGAGVAVITGVRTKPPSGEVYVSRGFVPVAASVRVNISILLGLLHTEIFGPDGSWAYDGFLVLVEYTDAQGKQKRTTKAEIRQYATQSPFVQQIGVTERRWCRQVATTTGQVSY